MNSTQGNLAPGILLQGRYRIVRPLGQGGFATVYLAQDDRLAGRNVAVKENVDGTQAAQSQFMLEAHMLANLSQVNLPRVTDYFVDPSGRQYLIMDYVEGEDLRSLVQQNGAMTEQQAIACISQILDALQYMHAQNPPIIHRDIKPDNIKLNAGKAILVDFGIAKQYDASQKTTRGARAISPGFSPVEQYGAGKTDQRSDLYSLGATMYFLVTGQDPPEATDILGGSAALLSPRRFASGLSMNTDQVIMKAMAPNMQQRFNSAQEMQQALAAPAPVQSSYQAYSPAPMNAAYSPAYPLSPPAPTPPPSMPGPAISAPQTSSMLTLAGNGEKFGALLIDWVIIFLVLFAFGICAAIVSPPSTSYSSGNNSGSSGLSTLVRCLSYLVPGLYSIFFLARSGQTPGMSVFHLKLVNSTGATISAGQAIGRYLASILSTLVLYIGYVIALGDDYRQTLHDKIAGTYVIKL